jgi:hypothetical protein
MSSCQSDSEEFREARIKEVRAAAKAFLKQVALNLCIPEGVSGRIDMAFGVQRKQVIAEVLQELGKELECDDGRT